MAVEWSPYTVFHHATAANQLAITTPQTNVTSSGIVPVIFRRQKLLVIFGLAMN